MKRSAVAFIGYVSLALGAVGACSAPPVETPDPEPYPNNGGTGATSGGVGGGNPTGGVGGGNPTGGVGGAVAGKGGAAVGGASAGVGSVTGGVGGGTVGGAAGAAVGGSAGTPAAGAGGSGTGGASTVSCDTAFAVGTDGFVRAPMLGGACWHGYASAGVGMGDMESMIMPSSFAMCGPSCMLTISGTVGSATMENNYIGVVFLGFNANQASGASAKGTIAPTGTNMVVTYSSTAAVTRIQISAGSAASTRWCATLTGSPATIPYTMFNTECWDGGMGTAYSKQAIDTVQLVVPGGETPADFSVTLTSISET